MAPSVDSFTNGHGNTVLNPTGNLPPLWNHRIDDYRPMKVICIGAGFSGIVAGIRFPEHIPNLDFTIYEKNADVGGTWYENRYPGVRCDIPCHSYQFTFESNTQWSEYYATGPEIYAYLARVAKKYGVYRFCKFRHVHRGSTWDPEAGKWHVKIEDLATGNTFTDTCDVLLTATGILNDWKWPAIEGFESYKGELVHTANWKPELTPESMKDREVALIGAGSSGIQVLPACQPFAKRIDHYFSGKTWISPIGFGSEELKRRGAVGNFKHTPEELALWKENPEAYLEFRHSIEELVNGSALITIFGTPNQQEFQLINREAMRKKLEKKPEVMKALEPEWPPGCRRLTPGPGYLEALIEDNVDFVSTKIKRFVPEGIETVDGKVRKVDLIICATGFDTSRKAKVPICGEDGIEINDVYDPTPESYFGIFSKRMPNLFHFLGPNGAPGTGGTLHLIEVACEYMIKCVQKMQREYIKSMVIKPRAMDMLHKHIGSYFTKTIYTQPCKSWMKRGKEDGKVITLWPGSCIHAVVAFDNPRYEDFDYTYLPETEDNIFSWLGKGLTIAQDEGRNTTQYLDFIVKPPVINPDEIEDVSHGGDLNEVDLPGFI